jgi:hypothetical protein
VVDAMDTGSRETTASEPRQPRQPRRTCELVTVPAREGLEAVAILRLRESVGPVLHDRAGDTLGFVVPDGTADRWDLPGSSCVKALGPFGTSRSPVSGGGWVVAPDGTVAEATEPDHLRAALTEASRLLSVVDDCTAHAATRRWPTDL